MKSRHISGGGRDICGWNEVFPGMKQLPRGGEGFRKVPCDHGRESVRAAWTATPIWIAGCRGGILPEGHGHCHAARSLDALYNGAGTCSRPPLTLAGGAVGEEVSSLPSSRRETAEAALGRVSVQSPPDAGPRPGACAPVQADSETLGAPLCHCPAQGEESQGQVGNTLLEKAENVPLACERFP